MLDRTGDPLSKTIPRLVGSLTEARPQRAVGPAARGGGPDRGETAQRLGMKPYPAQKLYAQVRNFSERDLDDAVLRLAELDHALKGGSRLANELELERALVEMTERD